MHVYNSLLFFFQYVFSGNEDYKAATKESYMKGSDNSWNIIMEN